MLKRMLLFGLVASLTGCGTTYQSAGKYKLLANISRDDVGKYKVDYFSNDKGNVDLNNVQYQGDTSDIFCGNENNTSHARAMNGGMYERVKCEQQKEFFREKTTFVGGSTETREVNLVFTRGRFESAVEEALLSSNIDRLKTINAYDAYVERHSGLAIKVTLPPDKFEQFLKQ